MKNSTPNFILLLFFIVSTGFFPFDKKSNNINSENWEKCIKGAAYIISKKHTESARQIKYRYDEKNYELTDRYLKVKISISWRDWNGEKYRVKGVLTTKKNCCGVNWKMTNYSGNIDKFRLRKNLECVSAPAGRVEGMGVGSPFKRKRKMNQN